MSTAAKMSSLSHATASTTFATTSRPEPHAESGPITDSNNVIEVERLFPRCLSSPNGGAAAVEPTSGCQFDGLVFHSVSLVTLISLINVESTLTDFEKFHPPRLLIS